MGRAPPGTYAQFAATLKRLMARQNMTQVDLAFTIWKTIASDGRVSGIGHVNHWCRGRNMPSLTNLTKIADALGVEISTLIRLEAITYQNNPQVALEPSFRLNKPSEIKRAPGLSEAEWKRAYHREYMQRRRATKPWLRPRHNVEGRNAQFAKRLKTLMDNRGWSQSQLAARLSVDRAVVWGWVKGRNFPNPENLRKLEQSLRIKVADLVPAGFGVRS
jgi:transcriptional regulator with XRE-family HTH domain